MLADTYPLRVLLMTFSGLVNHHQAGVIAYLVEENRVLKEQMTGRRLRLTDDQRRRLAAKAKLLGRRALDQVATIVTPDTLMKWHRRLIALKWTFAGGRVGRPGLMKAIKALIVRMAIENSSWGYCRIRLYGPPRVLEPVTLEYLSTECVRKGHGTQRVAQDGLDALLWQVALHEESAVSNGRSLAVQVVEYWISGFGR
ncbi:MAG TPA: hypothetical protein QF764_14120 [Planctomycetota bacterium]|nr:hypothetical protein [Planctomycetota bacterium]